MGVILDTAARRLSRRREWPKIEAAVKGIRCVLCVVAAGVCACIKPCVCVCVLEAGMCRAGGIGPKFRRL